MIRRLPAAATLAVLLLAVPAQAEPAGDPSVKRRLEAQSIKYAIDKDGDFKVTYNYRKEGRTQLVFVSGRTETVGGVPVREVFAPAAKADALDGAEALELLRASGGIAAAKSVVQQYAEQARAELDGLPDGPGRSAMASLVDYTVNRHG